VASPPESLACSRVHVHDYMRDIRQGDRDAVVSDERITTFKGQKYATKIHDTRNSYGRARASVKREAFLAPPILQLVNILLSFRGGVAIPDGRIHFPKRTPMVLG